MRGQPRPRRPRASGAPGAGPGAGLRARPGLSRVLLVLLGVRLAAAFALPSAGGAGDRGERDGSRLGPRLGALARDAPRGCALCTNPDICVDDDFNSCAAAPEYRNCLRDVLVLCHGHGICLNGNCVCDRGYGGFACGSCLYTHTLQAVPITDELLGERWSFSCVYTQCITDNQTGEVCNGGGECVWGPLPGGRAEGYYCDCGPDLVLYGSYRCYQRSCYDIPAEYGPADLPACSGNGECRECLAGPCCQCKANFTGSYCESCMSGCEYYVMADGTGACYPPSCMSSTSPGVVCGNRGECRWNSFAMRWQCDCQEPLVSVVSNCIHVDCASEGPGGYEECSGHGGCVSAAVDNEISHYCLCPDVYTGKNCDGCIDAAVRVGKDCVHRNCVENPRDPEECGGHGDCLQLGSDGSYACLCHSADPDLSPYCTKTTSDVIKIALITLCCATAVIVIVVVALHSSLKRKGIKQGQIAKETNMIKIEGEWVSRDAAYQQDFGCEEVLYL